MVTENLNNNGSNGCFPHSLLLLRIILSWSVVDVYAYKDRRERKVFGHLNPPDTDAAFAKDLSRDSLQYRVGLAHITRVAMVVRVEVNELREVTGFPEHALDHGVRRIQRCSARGLGKVDDKEIVRDSIATKVLLHGAPVPLDITGRDEYRRRWTKTIRGVEFVDVFTNTIKYLLRRAIANLLFVVKHNGVELDAVSRVDLEVCLRDKWGPHTTFVLRHFNTRRHDLGKRKAFDRDIETIFFKDDSKGWKETTAYASCPLRPRLEIFLDLINGFIPLRRFIACNQGQLHLEIGF
mmetsp:Transcript_34052/g.74669  ORF Transcript_34052/g.74669 Transcript_34052/m.74669 type:complete len:294 (-) Transcript_34052:206-1087(-)